MLRPQIAPTTELERELASAVVLWEERTFLAGPLRVVAADAGVTVLEHSGDDAGRAVARVFADRRIAADFVEARLKTYERMWDGCVRVGGYEGEA